MGIIYLVHPKGIYLRSIDKHKPKDRKKAPECNNENIKFGKHLGTLGSLQSRYESLVGDVYIKKIVYLDDSNIRIFENQLKKRFYKFIKNYQNNTNTRTQEWMSGIKFEQAEEIIRDEFEKFTPNTVKSKNKNSEK
tara:strand:- start:49 stop:456 length:408 start_codon:yes stop_codon:yes gene_type:complete